MQENVGWPTLSDIESLIKQGRSENLEFFECLSDFERVLQTLCAFLNNSSNREGSVLIGVNASGEMIGVGNPPAEPKEYHFALQKFEPNIVSTFWTIPFEDRCVIYINVPGAPHNDYPRHYKYNGCIYKRVGVDTVLLN